MSCSFCQIVQDGPSWSIRHGVVVSFKPFGGVNSKHRLFVPVLHVEGAGDAPELTAECFGVAARWGRDQGQDFNLVVNSGAHAGQTVFHLHVHYVPRVAGDGLGYRWGRDEL